MREGMDRANLLYIVGLSILVATSVLGALSMRAKSPPELAPILADGPPNERVAVSPQASSPSRPVVAIGAAGLQSRGLGALPAARTVTTTGRPLPLPDEAMIMTELHDLAGTDPSRALVLAREGNARYPVGPGAPERAWVVCTSLLKLDRVDEAKAEAKKAIATYPGTSWSNSLQRRLLTQAPRAEEIDDL